MFQFIASHEHRNKNFERTLRISKPSHEHRNKNFERTLRISKRGLVKQTIYQSMGLPSCDNSHDNKPVPRSSSLGESRPRMEQSSALCRMN